MHIGTYSMFMGPGSVKNYGANNSNCIFIILGNNNTSVGFLYILSLYEYRLNVLLSVEKVAEGGVTLAFDTVEGTGALKITNTGSWGTTVKLISYNPY